MKFNALLLFSLLQTLALLLLNKLNQPLFFGLFKLILYLFLLPIHFLDKSSLLFFKVFGNLLCFVLLLQVLILFLHLSFPLLLLKFLHSLCLFIEFLEHGFDLFLLESLYFFSKQTASLHYISTPLFSFPLCHVFHLLGSFLTL